MSLTTLIYFIDVGQRISVVAFILLIVGLVLGGICLFVAAVHFDVTGASEVAMRSGCLRIVRQLIGPLILCAIIVCAIPSRQSLYGMLLAQRAAGTPSSPALDHWLAKRVEGSK